MLFLALVACKTAPPPTAEGDADTDTDTDTDADTDADTDTDTEAPAVIELIAHPGQPLVHVGESVQLRTRQLFGTGSINASTSTTWSGTGPLASLTADGLLTGAAAGQVRLEATDGAFTVHTSATVVAATDSIASIALLPSDPTVAVGADLVFAAWATTTSGAAGDVAASCTWSSSDTTLATTGAGGVVQAVAAGAVTLTAACADGITESTLVTIDSAAAPSLGIAEVEASAGTGGVFGVRARIENTGGTSRAANVDFHLDAAGAPIEAPDARVSFPSLASGQSVWVETEHRFTGSRPATLTTWASVDTTEINGPAAAPLSAPIELPADVVADVRVVFEGATVFGPTDAGVIFEVFNDGPADLVDLVVYFDRDNPLATSLSDLDVPGAERHQVIPVLASGDSYFWVFDYDQVPFTNPWRSCGYVFADGFVDSDLTNNLACGEFPAY